MKKLIGLNKKKTALVCVLVFAVGLLICGLSLAFFSNRDVVTNKATSKEITIQLFEPQWQSVGAEKAAKMEPGMIIEKDPYTYNASEDDVYVRMKIVIKAMNTNATYVELNPENDADAPIYYAIMSAIYFVDSNGTGSGSAETPLVTKVASGYEYHNPSGFVLEDDGWFYYKEDGAYTVIAPGEGTTALFDHLKLPVLKSEYNEIFDSGFQIEIVAQAISATTYKDASDEEIKDAFERDFAQVSSEDSKE